MSFEVDKSMSMSSSEVAKDVARGLYPDRMIVCDDEIRLVSQIDARETAILSGIRQILQTEGLLIDMSKQLAPHYQD